MNYYSTILIDTGMIVAFYNKDDKYHQEVIDFFNNCKSNLITTIACVTESMWLLSSDIRSQNDFLSALSKGIFICENLILSDYERIRELNLTYQDLPGDFADLSLIAISERLNISEIATLDKDFNIYRRYRKKPFNRVFFPV